MRTKATASRRCAADQEVSDQEEPRSSSSSSSSSQAPKKKFLPHPLDGKDPTLPVLTIKELAIRGLSNRIREEERWWERVEDRAVRLQWVRKAWERVRGWTSLPRSAVPIIEEAPLLTREDQEFVRVELREGYRGFEDNGGNGIKPSIDCVWRADGLVAKEVVAMLIKESAILEKDFQDSAHPWADKQVRNLLDPSLYPLAYGITTDATSRHAIITRPAIASKWRDHDWTIPERLNGKDDIAAAKSGNPWSSGYQWLPSEVSIDANGIAKYRSYINNLDMLKHAKLYGVLEEVLTGFVPLFEQVLSDLRAERYLVRRVEKPVVQLQPLKKASGAYKPGEWNMGSLKKECGFERQAVTETLKGRTVKVITKMAKIVLTPEEPMYGGGSWHVEGMLNERIVASGILYYDQHNITESDLAFRQTIMPFPTVVGHGEFPHAVYGAWHGTSTQVLGHVITKTGRAIAFPNLFQHGVGLFELVDKTKPGHRKALVFFLVDPDEDHVVSTASVLPQQGHLTPSQLVAMRHETSRLSTLPEEVFQMILSRIPPAVEREMAERWRQELMSERTEFNRRSSFVQGAMRWMTC